MVLNEFIADQTKEKHVNNVNATINSEATTRMDDALNDDQTCDFINNYY